MAFATGNKKIKRYDEAAITQLRNTTAFNEKKYAEKTQQFILNANIPLSNERDDTIEENGGTVTQVGSEYRVRATSTADSRAKLLSEQRGLYISGNVAEAGIGVRVPTQPTGDAFIRWGYYTGVEGDDLVGFFYQYDANGISINLARSGTITQTIYQEDWNISDANNNVDGFLDPKNGSVYQINFVYYGYGPITFEVGLSTFDDTRYSMVPVHMLKVDESTSIEEPNLPICIEVDSGTSGQQLDAFIGGRQFSTFGKQLPVSRQTANFRTRTGIGTSYVPAVSFRFKDGFKNIQALLNRTQVLSSSDTIIQIIRNATLTGASFTTPTNYTASEIATEWDISATSFTGGQAIFTALNSGGNQNVLSSTVLPDRIVYEEDIITLAIRTVSATNVTATSLLEIAERW